jgi:hypothetical protein
VKTHLKDVFERLQVASRAELARLMSKAGPVHDVRVGITRVGDITITRGF